MTEPVSHGTAATVAVTAPTVAMLFQVWPFAFSFIAACVALIYMAAMHPRQAVASVVGGTLVGGSFSQLFAAPLLGILPSVHSGLTAWTHEAGAKMAVVAILAIALGLTTHYLMPRLLGRLAKDIEGKQS